ncbi:Propionyl-CoA carboxylase, biotin carboxylase and biotin-carboxyl carrier subunit [Seminavis robusta]|uniref:propionyl-CoA carboxylase n=1 Tax=Seminavis robusta TaxID=568900 RepID=A0A9N8DWQ3_9STRA|nr:Propionyl-CoA carboxylase, biotin carboxylase and biotin-carboxyl carrier subunit [Seminavis robusta]|eukprot:Sro434_g142010.1 Propionyl-CoA carboxylase, biotin carboxylase and biotin-carboxyl carrier subunit (754) ;mRNA; f:19636-21980
MWQRQVIRNSRSLQTRLAAKARCFSSTSSTLQQFDTPDGKPFRVMVANRGEIVQRIQRTCTQYPDLFETVVVHSTADAMAPFVAEASGSVKPVCIGPAAASQSYLNVDKILQTIEQTGSHMVHPGYGFLSENADFAKTITNAGVVWLGPPPHAVQEMGDKLRSKEVAVDAGVTVVPGYEGVLESVDQALEVVKDIGYPVLLKAAAGGGGKGMRICHNDQDLKEAYGMAKSEAKSFFSDDRLLIEKYIVNPHHIEFQVLCSRNPTTNEIDVVVFPERECSIQRRNQKVIEESPSVLLTEESRQKMVAQVRQLCKTVGYESAGTIEFLVEAPPGGEQSFYFLEMNTRLQVEHPISEAVCGVDLVKGMLWIGAGWGLPEEFHTNEPILPYKGHAIEARIYAEDPLRGFLPSTGPLRPYVEPVDTFKANPTAPEYTRMDSGVANGHVVTPFYDPMLSKTIYYAADRPTAVEGLATALDQYIIEGVQHNARLVNAVLRHPEFMAGNTPTSFLETHFPDGFQGVQLSLAKEEEMAVGVAMIESFKNELTMSKPGEPLMVQLGGMFGKAFKVTLGEETATVQYITKTPEEEENGAVRTVSLSQMGKEGATVDYQPRKYLAEVSLDNTPRFIQVVSKEATGELNVQMYGANMPVLIETEREYELSSHMHEPVKQDTTDIVPSPMPGTVMSYAVQEGDLVEDGQELCIVEAMKMQNIIRSHRKGVVEALLVKTGSSVAADEVIIKLVPETDDEEDDAPAKAA